MLDIKQEIQVLLLRQGLSMSKMTRNMNQKGLAKTNVASLSRMLSSKQLNLKPSSKYWIIWGMNLKLKRN